MIIHETLQNIPSLKKPIALTIGMFDGVHLGHQYLLSQLKNYGSPVVLTFSNHPLTVLNPDKAPLAITSPATKLELFKRMGIEMTLLISFSRQLAQTPYDQFLTDLHQSLSFSSLLLGANARLGAGAQGDAATIEIISKKLGFSAIFLPLFKFDDQIISSRYIRSLLIHHQFDQAEKLLGHLNFNRDIHP